MSLTYRILIDFNMIDEKIYRWHKKGAGTQFWCVPDQKRTVYRCHYNLQAVW